MGLKSYQQVWLERLSDHNLRNHWAPNQENHYDLNKQELNHLSSVEAHTLNQWAQANHEHRCHLLLTLFPEAIYLLLGPENMQEIVTQTLKSENLPPLYPQARMLSILLNQVLKFLADKQLLIPHLRDLIAYELAAVHLSFFSLPRIHPNRPGPVLSSWARVVTLGRHFPYVLEHLLLHNELPERSESPRQNFLILRDFRGLKLEALPSILAQCLQSCNGKKSWENIVAQVLAETSKKDLQLEKEALNAWLEQYLNRGILILNQKN